MTQQEDVARVLAQIFTEWDKAEKAIKIAEQVNGEIVNPAVYELRYAGRRLIEGMRLHFSGDHTQALKRLNDAHFDCCRARHDAIDAATAKISNDLAIAVKKIGSNLVLEHFADYAKLVRELQSTRRKIAVSREDRESRDKIYESIVNDNLEKIMEYYEDFQACEPLLKSTGIRGRLMTVAGFGGWVVATVIAYYSMGK